MFKNSRLRLGSCALTVLAFAVPAVAGVPEDVARLMEHVRKLEVVDDSTIKFAPPLEVMAALNPYRVAPDERVRLLALSFIADAALRNGKQQVLQEATRSFLDTAKNDKSPSIGRNALTGLLEFPRVAFTSKNSRDILHQLLMAPDPEPSIVLLSGIAEDHAAKSRLQEFAREPLEFTAGWWARRTWAAHLALARLGDPQEIQFCIDTIEKTTDPVTRVARLSKDLDYIRQPQSTKALIARLLGDRILPGDFPDVPDALEADYALPLLAKSIEDFPQPNYKTNETGTWLPRARAWVQTHQNDFKIKR